MNNENSDNISNNVEVSDRCIKRISEGKRVVIEATDASEASISVDEIFSYVDPVFKNWDLDSAKQASPEAVIEVYEQTEDAGYPKIFSSLGRDLDSLVVSAPQIKSFILNAAKEYLLEGEKWTCFRFLFKTNNEFFIADIRILADGGREVRTTPFSDGSVRHAQYHHRIVVPAVLN